MTGDFFVILVDFLIVILVKDFSFYQIFCTLIYFLHSDKQIILVTIKLAYTFFEQ